MTKNLIKQLMSDIENMAMTIEGEFGSNLTTIDDMIAGDHMPDSYYKLLEMLEELERMEEATDLPLPEGF